LIPKTRYATYRSREGGASQACWCDSAIHPLQPLPGGPSTPRAPPKLAGHCGPRRRQNDALSAYRRVISETGRFGSQII
jgi:hypothetical protein